MALTNTLGLTRARLDTTRAVGIALMPRARAADVPGKCVHRAPGDRSRHGCHRFALRLVSDPTGHRATLTTCPTVFAHS
jgi:hypothetical protein